MNAHKSHHDHKEHPQIGDLKPLHRFHFPLTPYQLFTPVASNFLDNLTYEEQLLGLYNKINELIKFYNDLIQELGQLYDQLNSLTDQINQNTNDIKDLKNQIKEIWEAIDELRNLIDLNYHKLIALIHEGDEETLRRAKEYTDYKFNSLASWGSITAGEYDSLNLTATKYESYQMTALQYDRSAKLILMDPLAPINQLLQTLISGSGAK